MLDELISAYGNRFLVAALGVSLALLCLFIVLWVLRNRAPSPFVRGGRNRQPRLQVLDAAAVDTRRRIVLIRRDNVEHLVMIGGPTDLVIESGIGDERHYLNARALQTQPIEDEARLAQQQTASLPATEPFESRPLPQSAMVAPKADLIERDLSETVRSEQLKTQVDASYAEISQVRRQQATAADRPRPAPIADRDLVQRPTAETSASVTAGTASVSRPAAPAGAMPGNVVRQPAAAPIIAAAATAAPAMAVQTPTSPARQSEPATVSTPTAMPRQEQPKETAPASAAFSPELHVGPTVIATQISAVDEPAAPSGRLIEEPATAISTNLSVQAAEEETTPALDAPAVTSPAVSASAVQAAEPTFVAPSIDERPHSSVVAAPSSEIEPPVRTSTSVAVEADPVIDVAPPVRTEAIASSAEDVLEAARARVLSMPVNEGAPRPFEAARFASSGPGTMTANAQPSEIARDESPAPRDISDFERVLEEEMALHIAADPGPQRPQPAAAPAVPPLLPETRPDRPRLPIGAIAAEPRPAATPAGANPAQPAEEPNLQTEIARIFGEMSASRNP
ncbi:hypothetical protein ASE36_09350 [Rhizobium sp. Root274]|uniref:flagellar biosynthetic protein FliO n=1 Tax=unclassified Rhizobium TaxID=2613769 RepID=UPI000714F052|nr:MULTISPECIES: flagellar biosynthetic protein FliO [unclassified Rhizobium]KQW28696.1 hypothetical protein ASC71_09365 [Rhizobium sp. Root1240]KRD28894.1 hypothetical protein ASE36_09350 [Rhizobium sp. Root274]